MGRVGRRALLHKIPTSHSYNPFRAPRDRVWARRDRMILEIALALTLKDIAWLAGDWQLTNQTRCIEEVWTAPSDNMLVGMSRTVAAGRTSSFEFMRIEARTDGIYY